MQPRLNDDEIDALINSDVLSDISDGDLEIDLLHDDEFLDSDEEQVVNVIDEPVNLYIDDDDLQVLPNLSTWDLVRTPPTSSAPTPTTSMDVLGSPSVPTPSTSMDVLGSPSVPTTSTSMDLLGSPPTSSAPTPSIWSTPSTSRGPIAATNLFLTNPGQGDVL